MPEIDYGNKEGKWFTDYGWERICDAAKDLIAEIGHRITSDLSVWYDPDHDFFNIRFDFEGEEYILRCYKVWGLTKCPRERSNSILGYDSDYEHMTFRRNLWDVFNFFRQDKHKTWPKKQ